MPLLSRIWLAATALMIAACVAVFALRSPLQTDLTALLPETEQNPVAEQALSSLNHALGNRSLYLVSVKDDAVAKAAARLVSQQLSASHAFRSVRADFSQAQTSDLVEVYAPHRFFLLSADDRQALEQGRAEEKLITNLMRPFTAGPGLDLAHDPFGLFADWLASLPLSQGRLLPEDGFLLSRDEQGTHILVVAEAEGSAFAPEIQDHVQHALVSAREAVAKNYPGVTILATGAAHYAYAARTEAQRDMDRIVLGSLTGIILLMWLVFRSPRPLLLALLSVATGISLGILVSLSVYGKLHLITLVFGASLVGEAVDYAIQYYAARMAAGSDWHPWRGRNLVLPAITLALATSLLGYGALALSPFPGLKQIALFSLAGLAGAWLTVVLVLPVFSVSSQTRHVRLDWSLHLLNRLSSIRHARALPYLLALAALAAIPGLLQTQGEDNIRLLINPPQDLREQEDTIRKLTGMDNSTRFILVEGHDAESVLQREEAAGQKLAALRDRNPMFGFTGLSRFVPSQKQQQDDHQLLKHSLLENSVLETLLQNQGFAPSVAKQFRRDTQASMPLGFSEWMATPLSVPYRYLWLGQTSQGFASVMTLHGQIGREALETATQGLPGVTLVDKAHSVSILFAHYRQLAAWGLLLAVGMVLAALVWRHGIKLGALILMPTALALLLTPALLTYAGIALTFFHMMALMLVLGVGVNYAIFLKEAGSRAPAVLVGVMLSAMTTLLSFGLLSLSSMPALHQFGMALLLGVSLAALFTPAVLILDKNK